MKKLLFISYSNENLNKVRLITKELTNHKIFEPLVVANKREPNKALVDKVTEGIKSSFLVIPILTKDSMNTQRINQEIGYAYGKNIKVIPIIESRIIDNLKGLIHKQKDLPYTYKTKEVQSMREENKSFMNCFRLLIRDLEHKENTYKTESKKESPLQHNVLSETMKKSPVMLIDDKQSQAQNVATMKFFRRNADGEFIENVTKQIGALVHSGEICPERGIWETTKGPKTEYMLDEGDLMLLNNSTPTTWNLIKHIDSD